MPRRFFRIGGWLALAAGAIVAASAVMAAVIGALALTGRVTYPVEFEVGPFSLRSTISTPVELGAQVCQRADISVPNPSPDCFALFVHEEEDDDECCSTDIRRQDADVRPTSATLKGEMELSTTGGWSPLVAATVAKGVVGLGLVSAILLLVWRLLAAAAAGEAFSSRAVRCLRGIGWLVMAGALIAPALDHFASPDQLGYTMEAFGPGPLLMPLGSAGYPGGIDLGRLALGALILVVAEVFRHGAAIEAERKLTI